MSTRMVVMDTEAFVGSDAQIISVFSSSIF